MDEHARVGRHTLTLESGGNTNLKGAVIASTDKAVQGHVNSLTLIGG
ncbi:hypothetical protein [Ralstonia solanacearum]|nr:hypothetical protein [Ralstonia solanacearum]